jgi:hypothetical protein
MPKRSNAFQVLIEMLEGQLAPSGAQVRGSQLLRDSRTGEDREVDVIIEVQIGIHLIRVGIEVTDSRRPASSPWIESISQKHADLPIHKSILVSRAGFFKPALLKARLLNIDTLTLEEANHADWKAKLDGLRTVTIESFLLPYVTKATLLLADPSCIEDLTNLTISRAEFYDPKGGSRGGLGKALDQMLLSPKFVQAVQQRALTGEATLIVGQLRFPTGTYIVGPSGAKHEVSGIAFEARCKKQQSQVAMERGRYRDVAVAFGEGDSFGHPMRFVFTERPDGENAGVSVRVSKNPGKSN